MPENVIEKLRSESRWLQRRLENLEASRRVVVAPHEMVVTKSGECFHVRDCGHVRGRICLIPRAVSSREQSLFAFATV